MASCYLKHWLSSFCFSNLSCCIYFKAITHWWATPLTRCYLSQWFHLSIDQNRPNTSQRLCIKVLSFAHSGFYCSQIYKQAAGELKDQDSQNSTNNTAAPPDPAGKPTEPHQYLNRVKVSIALASVLALILHWCGCWSRGGGLTCPGRSAGGGNVRPTDSFLWAELSCDRWVMVQRTSTPHANKCARALRSE